MKIAVLGTRGFPGVQGGVETHCENLYPRLVAKGCEVIVFTRASYVDSSIKEFKGVKFIPLTCPKNKFLEAFWHTLKGIFEAKRIKPDILHIHAIGPSLFIPLARLLGLKVVMTNHGPDYQRKKWGKIAKTVLKISERLGSRYADNIICISEPIAGDIRKKYKRQATVIPNGVVMPQILKSNSVLKKYGLAEGKYILSVGRFVPEKGFHDLIKAFNELQTENYKLVIVGRADHEDEYSLYLKDEANKNANIVLTGFLNGLPLKELYSHAGLFILPSYYEGLPIVLLEALSYGLSCLVADIPANREVDLSPERFFKAGDIAALKSKIREFIDKRLTTQEQEEQIKRIREICNWESIAEKTINVYQRLVGIGF